MGLHFQALHPLSFRFICTLHWCKHCTRLEIAPSCANFHWRPYASMQDMEVICRPISIGALFAPSRGLHLLALHPLSFLFMCTLHWCKHCTSLEVAVSLRKFPLTALCVDAVYGDALYARPGRCAFCTNNWFAFAGSHSLSFFFICTLHWCRHCTRLEVAASLRKFPLTALCVAVGYGGALHARPGQCAFCTNKGFAFSGSPSH